MQNLKRLVCLLALTGIFHAPLQAHDKGDLGYLMGIFTKLYAERESVFVQGSGQYDLEAISESRRQKNLEMYCNEEPVNRR
jgi:hypothetical protein